MADAAFDVVVIGGGTKALVTAIYLAKYGGMSVGIFERRHEMGGGLASSEAAAPGFIGDTHATEMHHYYYQPVQADFPDFEEKGGRLAYPDSVLGVITKEDQNGCVIYNMNVDPDQEKSTADIARYAGSKDAETYQKLWGYASKNDFFEARNQTVFNLPPPVGEPTALDRWFSEYMKQPDCVVDMEWLLLQPMVGAYQLFEHPGLAFMFVRKGVQRGVHPSQHLGGSAFLFRGVIGGPEDCFAIGGTHSIAHAYVRIFLENGGKFFTHSHVDKLIVENGTAKGICLSDGTQIEARKLVLSGINPDQLCFDLVGRDYFSQRVIKKVEDFIDNDVITWYTWALCDIPRYKAAEFNPDFNGLMSLELGSRDREVWTTEVALRRLGKNPPVKDTLSIRTYLPWDKSRAPEGRCTVLTEQYCATANMLTEQEWLEFKKIHAEDVMREWHEYAPNMTWDNVIGYDPKLPYDCVRELINMAPWGGYSSGPRPEHHRPLNMRPIMEWANYRITPIKNLYGAGAAWQMDGSCQAGYVAYKAIAEDFGLRKPWEEKGRAW